ncbi:MAG TPA: alanine--tRNA ligase [Actinomycetes bacterium]|nr:alanine--tRNA ligase [Actinomycetes bacterium]
MDVSEIRARFLRFFEARGHAVIASAPVVPVNDPTTLFTSAGMQPLVPYFLGQPHPSGRRLVDVQKCVRTDDIDEVGDATHLTFLEMLGRWSLGDYFKERAIELSFELLTSDEGFRIQPGRLYVTFFAGDGDAPRDEAARARWQQLFRGAGVDAAEGDPREGWQSGRLFAYGKRENWWGPVGETGPCGPDAEMFIDTGREHDDRFGPVCHPACGCGRFVEIGNDVFLQFDRRADGTFAPLAQRNVDTGMGLERLAQVLLGADSVYETEAFRPLIAWLERASGRPYQSDRRSFRIVADHLRAATVIAADGVSAGNVHRGYVLRRLIRRAVRYGRSIGLPGPFCAEAAEQVVELCGDAYPELREQRQHVTSQLALEEERFGVTLDRGLRKLTRLLASRRELSGADAFSLYDTHGFPVELTVDLVRQGGGTLSPAFTEEFGARMEEQKQRSRTAAAGTFKGGLGDRSPEAVWFHTVTHLTQAALRRVLGEHVHQRGSNITAERMRFDFSHPAKLTDDEKQRVEELVNDALGRDLEVRSEQLPLRAALETGALAEFGHRYGDVVTVYTIADPGGRVVSREICGGPHVRRTGEIRGEFKIVKEASVGAGVRRVTAVLKPR